MTYVRCHDDIGWNVLAAEAAGDADHAPYDLARVTRFYAGETPDSYARGRSFQCANPDHVHGSNGMASALAGIEAAQAAGDAAALAQAERRLLLLYGIAFAASGLPLIYMGDEIALGNDRDFERDPRRAGEGRWLHRPAMDWAAADAAATGGGGGTAGRIAGALRRMIAVRTRTPALRADVPMRALMGVSTGDRALLALARGEDFLLLANFGAQPATVAQPADVAAGRWRDLLDCELLDCDPREGAAREIALPFTIAPYALHWLSRA
jgi:amylosucrase